MLKVFETFSPRVQKLLRLAPEGNILEWALRVYKAVPQWSVNNVALLGDALVEHWKHETHSYCTFIGVIPPYRIWRK